MKRATVHAGIELQADLARSRAAVARRAKLETRLFPMPARSKNSPPSAPEAPAPRRSR
jgi:hypothetical protein